MFTTKAQHVRQVIRELNHKRYTDDGLLWYTQQDTLDMIKAMDHTQVWFRGFPDLAKIHGLIGIDIETTGLSRYSDLVGVGIWLDAYQEGYYVHNPDKADLKLLNTIFQYPETNFCLHNSKFDRTILFEHGVYLPKDVEDTIILAYILNPSQRLGLKQLAKVYLRELPQTFRDIVGSKDITKIDPDILGSYCVSDSYLTCELFNTFYNWLTDKQVYLYRLDLDIAFLLFNMETVGIAVDGSKVEESIEWMSQQLERLQALIGCNPNSNQQLSELMISKNLHTFLPTTKTGYSTAKTALMEILYLDPVVQHILDYKAISKLKSTYLEGFKNRIVNGTIHGSFNQTKTDTGRLSSSDPNMQNIPAIMRQIFISRPKKALVALDYSQCELRILAYLSSEAFLIDAFTYSRDVHTEVTKFLMGKDSITKEERRYGKTLNFGVIYGMGPHKLARMLGIDLPKAKELLSTYWDKLPKIKEWLLTQYHRVIFEGYVETILGRRRYLDVKSHNFIRLKEKYDQVPLPTIEYYIDICKDWDDLHVFRQAGNAPIQGSNADITKLAMVNTVKTIYQNDWDAQLLLQIHDELVFEVDWDIVDDFIPEIQHIMSTVVDLGIPLVVDYEIGTNWSECK